MSWPAYLLRQALENARSAAEELTAPPHQQPGSEPAALAGLVRAAALAQALRRRLAQTLGKVASYAEPNGLAGDDAAAK